MESSRRGWRPCRHKAGAPRERQEWSRLDALIKHEQQVVERLERRVMEAKRTDPDKAAKITVRLQRTRFFLERLRAEQRANAELG